MRYFIGADLGTSALKLLLCEESGKTVASVSKEYCVYYPSPGHSEQEPSDWWNAFSQGMLELTKGIDKSKIVGIGVAGQMHGLVILDENDCVIRPAILWNDGRTDKETEYLNKVIGTEALTGMTANIAFAGFTAPKLLWLKNNEPHNFKRIAKIMLPKDYINYKLTGVHACDYSDASGMLLLDVKNRCWSREMLKICGVNECQMPRLTESYQSIGSLLPEIASQLGLSPETAVAGGAGDNAGAAVGMGTLSNGKCNISIGTSGTVFVSSDKFVCDSKNALHYFCHANGKHHIMGCILSAASCHKWFCNNVLHTDDYSGTQKALTEALLGKNTVYFLPYLMGERSPINDTDATGMFIGLRPDTSSEDMTLAILEGVAFAIRDNLEAIKSMGVPISSATVCGGGAKSPVWLKILANVLNITLFTPENEEGPSLGAAYLAMMASGACMGFGDLPPLKTKTEICPSPEIAALYDEKYRKFKKIYPHIKNLYKEIKE
ncbi:MAG: xylulokinase [Clostridia bacterium]|nr:xylulokinase [Clostridia bacterium]